MAKVSKSILAQYNKCPELAAKWANILDSYRHVFDQIPVSDILNFAAEVQNLIPSNLSEFNNDLESLIADLEESSAIKTWSVDKLKSFFIDAAQLAAATVDNSLNLGGELPAFYAPQSEVTLNTADRHSHTNKSVLDKFGEATNGKPTYNGNAVDTTIAQRDVYDGLDSNDNTISLAAKQGKELYTLMLANLNALANRLRTDIDNQNLTPTEKANAIANLGITKVFIDALGVNAVALNGETREQITGHSDYILSTSTTNTITTANLGKVLRVDTATATTVTVNSASLTNIGDRCYVDGIGVSEIALVEGAGVTINTNEYVEAVLDGKYSRVCIEKTGVDTYFAFGNLRPL